MQIKSHSVGFTKEAEMLPIVTSWLKRRQYIVKSEFMTPWGICDLVGAKLNKQHVGLRFSLGQTSSINSMLRAEILSHIPDKETRHQTSMHQLAAHFANVIPIESVKAETEKLIKAKFVERTSSNGLHKLNGWAPLHEHLIAIELKLSRVTEAFLQARNNLSFACSSYIAVPDDLAKRVRRAKTKWNEFISYGIGLLGVKATGCRTYIQPTCSKSADVALQMYCADKFLSFYKQDIINGCATASGRLSVPD